MLASASILRVRVTCRDGQFAPHRLAEGFWAPAPVLGEGGDDGQAAAGFVAGIAPAAGWQRRGGTVVHVDPHEAAEQGDDQRHAGLNRVGRRANWREPRRQRPARREHRPCRHCGPAALRPWRHCRPWRPWRPWRPCRAQAVERGATSERQEPAGQQHPDRGYLADSADSVRDKLGNHEDRRVHEVRVERREPGCRAGPGKLVGRPAPRDAYRGRSDRQLQAAAVKQWPCPRCDAPAPSGTVHYRSLPVQISAAWMPGLVPLAVLLLSAASDRVALPRTGDLLGT